MSKQKLYPLYNKEQEKHRRVLQLEKEKLKKQGHLENANDK